MANALEDAMAGANADTPGWMRIATGQAGFYTPASAGPMTVEVDGLPEHLVAGVLACSDGPTAAGWPFLVGQPVLRARVEPGAAIGTAIVMAKDGFTLDLSRLKTDGITGLLISVARRDMRAAEPGIAWGEIGLRFIQRGAELGMFTGADVPSESGAAILVQGRLVLNWRWLFESYTVVGVPSTMLPV